MASVQLPSPELPGADELEPAAEDDVPVPSDVPDAAPLEAGADVAPSADDDGGPEVDETAAALLAPGPLDVIPASASPLASEAALDAAARDDETAAIPPEEDVSTMTIAPSPGQSPPFSQGSGKGEQAAVTTRAR